MRNDGKNRGRLLPAALLILAFATSVAAYARLGRHYPDADLASEMVLSDLLNREGRLVTDSWYYSSELRVVSPVPLYQLGLALFSSWHAARVFAVSVMLALTLACFLYMARSCGLAAGGLYAAAVLALPASMPSFRYTAATIRSSSASSFCCWACSCAWTGRRGACGGSHS